MVGILFISLLIVHVVAAAAWVGGQIAHEFAFSKKLGVINASQAGLISKHAEYMFTVIPWISLITMSATGLVMVYLQGMLTVSGLLHPIGWPLLASMILTLVALINGVLLTFYFPPKLSLYKYSMSPAFRNRVMFSIKFQNRIGITIIVLMVIYAELIHLIVHM